MRIAAVSCIWWYLLAMCLTRRPTHLSHFIQSESVFHQHSSPMQLCQKPVLLTFYNQKRDLPSIAFHSCSTFNYCVKQLKKSFVSYHILMSQSINTKYHYCNVTLFSQSLGLLSLYLVVPALQWCG